MSLGGVRDEAEIRGHRRTYIGALPGKVIQSMRKAGSGNPVLLLDEVDKMSTDFRGDPSSALLEVLDPEQNNTFNDHYLDCDYDLVQGDVHHDGEYPGPDSAAAAGSYGRSSASRATPKSEKLKIAKKYLVTQAARSQRAQRGEHRVLRQGAPRRSCATTPAKPGSVTSSARSPAVCRKVAVEVVKTDRNAHVRVIGSGVRQIPRPAAVPLRNRGHRAADRRRHRPRVDRDWAASCSSVEVTIVPGRGKLTITGQLGEVMQESAQAAMSYVRSRADALGLPSDFYHKIDIHIHIPEGAIPKDGPSAGITLATALVSALCRVPVRNDLAMTGEITLRGRVLPIGGLKEKVLAAHRGGIKIIADSEGERKGHRGDPGADA